MRQRFLRMAVTLGLLALVSLGLGALVLGDGSGNSVALPYVSNLQQATTPTVTPTPGDSLGEVIEAGGTQPPPPTAQDVIVATSTAEAGDWRYAYEVHDEVDNIRDITYLGLNDDVLWPGSLIRGAGVPIFVYDPILAPRAPLTISLSVEGAGCAEQIARQVVNPSLSTMRQGISDLIGGVMSSCGTIPAQSVWKYEQIFSESQMDLFAQVDLSAGGGSLHTRFDWQDQDKKTKIMASFRQVLYSVDIDTPMTPAEFFDPSVTPAQLAQTIPPGSMPLYVSGVKYGMMAFMFIESQYAYEEMKLALDAAYDNGTLDIEGKFGVTYREMLNSSSIEIVVYGGSVAGLAPNLNGLQGFQDVVQANIDAGVNNPGVPLVYKFKHLHNNTLAYVTLTSQYTLVRPIQIRQRVRVSTNRFQTVTVDDEGTDNTVDIDRLRVLAAGRNRASDGAWQNVPGMCDLDSQNSEGDWYKIYYESTSGWWPMDNGSYRLFYGSCLLTYNTAPPWDWSFATLKLSTWARDWDTSNSNSENAYGLATFVGDAMLGPHQLDLGCEDFTAFFLTTVDPLYTQPDPPPAPSSLTEIEAQLERSRS